jgi:hypothetical protein
MFKKKKKRKRKRKRKSGLQRRSDISLTNIKVNKVILVEKRNVFETFWHPSLSRCLFIIL